MLWGIFLINMIQSICQSLSLTYMHVNTHTHTHNLKHIMTSSHPSLIQYHIKPFLYLYFITHTPLITLQNFWNYHYSSITKNTSHSVAEAYKRWYTRTPYESLHTIQNDACESAGSLIHSSLSYTTWQGCFHHYLVLECVWRP